MVAHTDLRIASRTASNPPVNHPTGWRAGNDEGPYTTPRSPSYSAGGKGLSQGRGQLQGRAAWPWSTTFAITPDPISRSATFKTLGFFETNCRSLYSHAIVRTYCDSMLLTYRSHEIYWRKRCRSLAPGNTCRFVLARHIRLTNTVCRW